MLENTGTFLLGIGPNNFHAASSLAGLFVSEERERGSFLALIQEVVTHFI